jgi:YidC/Oxa1 family membrane protein insertase
MWTWLKDGTFWLMEAVYNFCGDWGLAIIIITIIFRVLIYPITAKQTRSTYAMTKIQPYIKEIQEKYAGDQQRMNEEMMKIYADHKFNPLGGCLPLLLQMPIFIILYQTLLEYIPEGSSFYAIIPNLAVSLKTVWMTLGAVSSIPYIVLVVLFTVSTFIPMVMQGNMERQTMIMGVVMSIFMLWIGLSAPAGVMLYWVVSSLFGIVQNQVIRKSMDSKEEKEKLENPVVTVEPVKVDVERRERKPRPTKKR